MTQYNVRHATPSDADWIVALSSRVQATLTATGSLQQIGPLTHATVLTSIQAGTAYLLESPARRLGCVFVDPVTASYHRSFSQWNLDADAGPRWYLHALMIEPKEQGKGLGKLFLDGIREQVLSKKEGTIILSCWAGNSTLRDFYSRAGWTFHGVFPHKDFEVAVFLHSS